MHLVRVGVPVRVGVRARARVRVRARPRVRVRLEDNLLAEAETVEERVPEPE